MNCKIQSCKGKDCLEHCPCDCHKEYNSAIEDAIKVIDQSNLGGQHNHLIEELKKLCK